MKRSQALLAFESEGACAPARAPRYTAGVDEAGRGPLAGPVVAAAVILNPKRRIHGIADSKQMTADAREKVAAKIRQHALAWSVAWADVAEIDALNILQATFLAMRRALCGLRIAPTHIQVDGNRAPSVRQLGWECEVETIIGGDASVTAIGAASILAKTTRDAMLREYDKLYPGYGFASHKGYCSTEHFAALDRLGPCPIHRKSFEPVRVAAREASIEVMQLSIETWGSMEGVEVSEDVMGDG